MRHALPAIADSNALPRNARRWRLALVLLLACFLFGCRMSHIESAKQELGPEEQAAGGEQASEPGSQPETTPPETEPPAPESLPQDRGPANPPVLSIADVTAAEDDGTLDFRVSVSRAPGAAVSVQYETENGTAAAGSDYEPASGTLQFPPGSAAALPIQVTVHDDAVAEAAETFVVRLSNAQGATLAAATATGTITDNDTRALVVRPGELTVLEGGSAEFEVVLGSRPTGPVTVDLDNAPELAVDPGELRFEPGTWQDARTVTVTAAQDEDSAADDPVLLRVAARGGGYDGVQESVQVTTAEDDAATLAISGARAAEGAGRLRFELTLTAASSAEVSVSYATGSPDDSATAGEDYRAGSDTVRFAAGSAGVRTIEVTVHDDTTDEPDEQVTLTLSNARNAVLVGGATTLTAVGVIEDDDEPPRVGIGDSSASEGTSQGELRFTVTLARASGRVVTVRYATGNVTAAAGSDYTGGGRHPDVRTGCAAADRRGTGRERHPRRRLRAVHGNIERRRERNAGPRRPVRHRHDYRQRRRARAVDRQCPGPGGRRTPSLPGDPRQPQRQDGNGGLFDRGRYRDRRQRLHRRHRLAHVHRWHACANHCRPRYRRLPRRRGREPYGHAGLTIQRHPPGCRCHRHDHRRRRRPRTFDRRCTGR